MKPKTILTSKEFSMTTACAAGMAFSLLLVDTAQAQTGGGRGQGRGGMMRMLPVMRALDADGDGALSSEEIEKASTALKSLDQNGDGSLSEEELRPTFGGRAGRGGENGPGSQGKKKNTTVVEVGEQAVKVEMISPEEVYDGYLYWHQADELNLDGVNYSILADEEGKVVHRWDTDLTGGGHTSYLLESGGILRIGKRNESGIGPVASADTMQITDRTGKAIWQLNAEELEIEGNRILFHHDMQMRPNGNIFALIYEELSKEEAAAAGWTPENVASFWSDGVMEIKPNLEDGSHEVVWQWRFIDHIVQDKNPESENYGVVAEHPRRIDAHYPPNYNPSFGAPAARQHLNSVDYNAELDQLLLSSFIYDEIWIIDRGLTAEEASGRAGDLLFRYGNPAVYDQGDVKDRLFAKQHDAGWIRDGLPGAGHLMVFNNNNRNSFSRNFSPNSNAANGGARGNRGGGDGGGRSLAERAMTGVSNVQEFLPVVDDNGAYVVGEDGRFQVKPVWSWEEEGFFATTQGSAKRLPNGNTLLSNTGKQFVIEVTSEGKIVARYEGSAPSYKAFKFTNDQLGDLLE